MTEPSSHPHPFSGEPGPAQAADPAEQIRRLAVTLTALAEDGLVYATGEFDIARYQQMSQLSRELLTALSGVDPERLHLELALDGGYVTPKIDVRAALFDDQHRVLLMKERLDNGRWSLPGGWADPGDTPALAAQREMLEEAGHHVKVVKVVGVWDRDARGHTPPMSVSVTKLFMLCQQVAAPVAPSELETLDIGWFPLDELPELSVSRVTRQELETCLRHHLDHTLATEFD